MAVLGIPILDNLYPVTMDMWPVQAKEFNRIWQFYENLKQGRFTTTKCKDCGKVVYPPRVICPECYSEQLEYVDLPKRGKVIVFSEEVRGVPLGFEAPLIHAVIDLGVEPVRRLLSRIINCPAGYLKEGDEVQLVVFPIPSHPIDKGKQGTVMVDRVFFAFEPVKKP
ncbi:MAG: Zn-ribbon domain-containing OB-fold protein [Desulfobacterota bacterium]|nr:Zn-ribbon domain-containing OB-fold protein [Thermodesulfobacteriota bacterium]MDW8002769.1 Zn-ribbon domain-containing OB-fold protein [Deltaproteobacteria bacterium]